jgi:predicted PurR-regulated permease PerM
LGTKKIPEDVTQDSVKRERNYRYHTSLLDTLLDITLIPIYTFLILLYRTHFILFLTKLFRKEHHSKLQEILSQIKGSVQSYISGLIIEMIFFYFNEHRAFIIGVPYFMLLGIITGILNLIPYVGI